jgi:Na+-driven multidrug efflux pump
MKPEFGTVTKIAKLGVPSAVEQSALGLGFTIMAAIVAGYGTVALAAYGIGTRLISVLSMPAMGFSMALGIMVGQNLGAGKEKRASRITWLSSGTTLLVLAVGSAVCFLLAKPLVSAFMTQQEYEVIELGTEFLKLIALGLSPFGVRVVIGGAFRGAGDTLASMILSILALWGLRIPLAIGLGAEMGVSGVWYSIFLSNLAGGLIAAVWFRRGKWVEKSISGRGWAPRPQSRIPPSPETEK